MSFKVFLKRSRLIYNLNASLKAFLTRKRLEQIGRRYCDWTLREGLVFSPDEIPSLVQAHLRSRNISLEKCVKGRMRIFWVGANEDQDNSGFLDGLRKFGEVLTFVNRSGEYGLEFSSGSDVHHAKGHNSRLLLQQVKSALDCGPIDLLIGQMWANFISVEALKAVQELKIPTVNIAMDDRLPEMWAKDHGAQLGAVGLASGTDLTLTTCPECPIRYLLHGCPAIYWPLGSDPELFKPCDEKLFDVCFVGNNYGIRSEIVTRLQKSGIRVEAFGAGWPNGSIHSWEIAKAFGQSRIILGVGTIGYNPDIFTLKLRDFDAPMAGALYITHRNPDLLNLFEEGKEIECYMTIEEAEKKISYYLLYPEKRDRLARAAALKARELYTWEKRIDEALQIVGLEKRRVSQSQSLVSQ